jgi:pimeloyl-ACP methyl ester carboxylesterase
MIMAESPKTFVLVHGAWHGGWCWVRVARLLREQGHQVFTPTLTGLGERSHLLAPGITLKTHITDVVNMLKWERLEDVVLCGHSYGGMVISGVAEEMQRAIGAVVFLDAFVPENGQALIDATSQATRERIQAAAQKSEIAVPPPAAAVFNVNEKDRAWVDALCGPHPIATLTDKIALTGARDRIAKKTYIRAKNYPNPGFDKAYEQRKGDPAWRTYEAPCGHDVMVDMPERLTEILLEVA